MFVAYPVIFYKNRDEKGYTIVFPDLNIVSCADDEQSAVFMAEDLLGTALYDYYVNDWDLPRASSIMDIKPSDDLYDLSLSFTSLVGLDLGAYVRDVDKKTVRKNVSIPSYLNELGKARGVNFSQVLQEALKLELDVD